MRLFVLLLFPFWLDAQIDKSLDSLKKYSYQISGSKYIPEITTVHTESGTCFFVRKNGFLFLVTAKHIISGCNDSLFKDSKQPDEMAVFVPTGSKSQPFNRIPLNIKKIKDTCSCFEMKKAADVVAIQITDTAFNGVYSVENLLSSGIDEFEASIIIGFDEGPTLDGINFNFHDPKKIPLLSGTYGIFANRDPFTYWIASPSVETGEILGGVSGSPFFVQDIKTHKFNLQGVFIASGIARIRNTTSNVLYVVKNEFIFRDIDFSLRKRANTN